MIVLSEQISIISDQLSKALKYKEIEDVVRLCHFHYENWLYRIYALRERAWDAIAALAGISRKSTSNSTFRSKVLSKIDAGHPELYKAFLAILNLINSDVELRNVATHKTILMLGLMQDDVPDIWEIEAILLTFDPQSENGIQMHQLVRRSLREFIAKQKQHFQDVFNASLEFSKQCDLAIHKNHW